MNIKVFINLIRNEFLKVFFQKKTLVLLGLLVISIGIYGFAMKKLEPKGEWKGNARANIEKSKKLLIDIEKNMDNYEDEDDIEKKFSQLGIDILQEEIEINEYGLKNNIAVGVITPLKFLYDGFFITILIFIFILMQAANITGGEYSNGTIKQMLIKPISRWKILFSKHITIIFLILIFLLIYVSMALLVGLLFFAGNGFSFTEILMVNNEVIETSLLKLIFQKVACLYTELAILCIITISIAIIVKNTVLPIIISVIALISNVSITLILKEHNFVKYLITTHMNLSVYIKDGINEIPIDGMTLQNSIIIISVYMIVFLSVSYIIFTKRDVY